MPFIPSRVLTAVLPLLMLTLSLGAADDKPEITDKVRKHLGDKIVAVLQSATEVEVYRLAKGEGDKTKGFAGY
jgi:hypothetical protein